ncbi:MAG: CYTH domain-containing protein [Gemmatimonadaceae bacterium]
MATTAIPPDLLDGSASRAARLLAVALLRPIAPLVEGLQPVLDRLCDADGRLESDPPALVAELDAAAGLLAARGRVATEIERKFLLDALPEVARAVAPRRIAQGYLPGTELVERVRRVAMPDGAVRCWRTVKLGVGIARIEVEEETTPQIFDALWALTAGRRLTKRRHLVTDGALTWEMDDFDDRDLVLAEVELESAATAVTIPDWLAPHVVREVTGEDAYVNVNLAG